MEITRVDCRQKNATLNDIALDIAIVNNLSIRLFG